MRVSILILSLVLASCAFAQEKVDPTVLELKAQLAEAKADNAYLVMQLHQSQIGGQNCEAALSRAFASQIAADKAAVEQAQESAESARKIADAEKSKK